MSLPDVSLLPKLSALLDADIELLLQGGSSGLHKQWSGLLDLRKFDNDLAQTVYDKPMVYFILSHFLLMGIRKIYILGDVKKQSWLMWDSPRAMGFDFIVNPKELSRESLMIMRHPCFLFGSDLTRRFQAAMSTARITKLCPLWDITPFLFCPAEYAFMYYKNPDYLFENAVSKTLGRGMICFPLDTPNQVNDVASFIRMYQMNTGLNVHNLHEIVGTKTKQ